MRIAAIYDIHGNLPALEAVLADVDQLGVDAIVVGGDLAWSAPPSPTIERLMELGDRAHFILGNADVAHVKDFDLRPDPVATRAAREQRDLLAGMAATLALTIDGLGPALFCHGSPRNEDERITSATPEARLTELLDGVVQPLIVCGHTHRQFDRTVGGCRVLNPGSVGLPFEGRTGAFWAVLGPTVQMRCSDYDLEAALAWFAANQMPESFARRLEFSLLTPADPDEVARYFEKQSGRPPPYGRPPPGAGA
jgi:predicted phosphodiesterase